MTGKCLAALAFGVFAWAQHQHGPTTEKPAALLGGMGAYSHQIQTSVPQAQRFFDQGLNLLYGFNRYEALRSFRKAAELDPKAIMPRWGIAMAQGPHINMDLDGDVDHDAYCKTLREADSLKATASEPEKAWIEAASARCPKDDPAAYIAAMRRLSERYPDDQDALTLYAESLMLPVRWRWWSPEGAPADGTVDAVRVLEEVMRRNPDHPGANHFYIHAVENSPSPERAVPSAQRLMGIVPSAGHLVHMPGHIWLILGDYEMAAAVNERAAEVDRQYMKTTGVTGSAYAGYYVHNLHFIAVARAMQGRKADALKASADVAKAVEPFIKEMPMMADAFIPVPWFTYLRFQMWEEMLSEKPPAQSLLTATAMYHYARGSALAALKRNGEANREREAFRAAAEKVPADWIWLNNKSRDMAALASAVLDARLAANDTEAIPHWKKAVELEDRLVYDEPPPWFFPIREPLGAALLRSGNAAEAEAVFRAGLKNKPRNGRLLFGLMEALTRQGKSHSAALVRQEYQAAWKRADVPLKIADLW